MRLCMDVKIRYARTSDGVDIAYAVHGAGQGGVPLLAGRSLLRAPVDSELGWMDEGLPEIAERRTVVLWDWRSLGLSAAATAEYTIGSTLRDIGAVADAAGGPEFDLMAWMTPCHTAIAYAAKHPDRVRRLVLWNPSFAGMSPRGATLADLPDIASTHFAEYIRLAALRIFGWERADLARRWERDMLAQFAYADWERLMSQMEAVDGTGWIEQVQCPTLVILDLTAPDPRIVTPLDRQAFIRSVAARLPRGELAIIKRESGRRYGDAVNAFLAAADGGAPAAAAHGTAIILFADIVDSTAMTERMGDAAFRAKARELDGALRTVIRECGGTVIDAKTLGDGVLATFAAAAQAIETALRFEAAAAGAGLQLHVGLHAGDVIREEGNVFGGAVNVAARISALSAPGEVLVSDLVRGLARTSAGVVFEDRGEQALKGVGEPVRVFAVRGAGA